MQQATSHIAYSERESKILSLRVGRYNTQVLDGTSLEREIRAEFYDLIRVKVDARDANCTKELYETQLPFFFSGGIRRYQVDCMAAALPAYTHGDIHFELYTPTQNEVLKELMYETLGDNAIGYYKSPILCDIITREKEFDCLFDYYTTHYVHELNSLNYLWFMKKGEEYIGFIALNTIRERNMVDSSLAGIKRTYQGQGLFVNILRHIRGFCRSEQLRYFCCGARLDNMYSQWAFEHDYMKATCIEYVFHVVPLLSLNPIADLTRYR